MLKALNDQSKWRDSLLSKKCSIGLCHGDLNCSNIVMLKSYSGDYSPKLIDFASVKGNRTQSLDWAKVERDIKLRSLRDHINDPDEFRMMLEKIDTFCNKPESINFEDINPKISKLYISIIRIREQYCKNVKNVSDIPYLEYLINLFYHILAFNFRDDNDENCQFQFAVLDSVLRTKNLIDQLISSNDVEMVFQGPTDFTINTGEPDPIANKETINAVVKPESILDKFNEHESLSETSGELKKRVTYGIFKVS